MSEGMLGKLSLREIRGTINDLWDKLAGENGPECLSNLKKMLRGERTGLLILEWMQPSPHELNWDDTNKLLVQKNRLVKNGELKWRLPTNQEVEQGTSKDRLFHDLGCWIARESGRYYPDNYHAARILQMGNACSYPSIMFWSNLNYVLFVRNVKSRVISR